MDMIDRAAKSLKRLIISLLWITMMKDVSLKGKTGISNERIVNKIQDFIWDDVLSRYVVQKNFLSNLQNIHLGEHM